ncbi:uncharacterized protein [Lepeophtheirus salmonis]|uniref:uncharacterized protein n=1 Tax=Lepeophtheirus salmonis TaxID=72036 RepID=UPI001AE1D8E2|nr:serine/threonine-protein kinase Nek1-like [Lepeophtheirus salmonis]
MDNYEIVRKIGQGSFGNVYIVSSNCKKNENSYVMKEIKTSQFNEKEREDVSQEVDLLSRLNHSNIVSYYESFSERNCFYIIMEYCELGDLYTKINRQRGKLFPETLILGYFVQICRAVEYIHERKILHRDIKSQNILISKNRVCKLGDFGIARIIDGTTDYAKTCVGTPYYLSPEVWENKPYNNKSDLWALGCVLYEMTTLKHAFEAGCMKNLILKIIRGSYPPISPTYTYDLRNLIQALLRKKASDRPSLTSIFRKGFIKKAEQDNLRSLSTHKKISKSSGTISSTQSRVQSGLSRPKSSVVNNKSNPTPKVNLNHKKLTKPSKTPVKQSDDTFTLRVGGNKELSFKNGFPFVQLEEKPANNNTKVNPEPENASKAEEESERIRKRKEIISERRRKLQSVRESNKNNSGVMWIDFSDSKSETNTISDGDERLHQNDTFVVPINDISGEETVPEGVNEERGGGVLKVFKKFICTANEGSTVFENHETLKKDSTHSIEETTEVQEYTNDYRSQSLPAYHPYYRKPREEFREIQLERPDSSDEIWDLSSIPKTPSASFRKTDDIFSTLEGQRAYLERRVGVDNLLTVYKLISNCVSDTDDDKQLHVMDFQKILGKGNETLIDDIVQLVVADQFFQNFEE